MPRITLQSLDVFAILDADSDEAKGFTTYLGYWDGIARLIVDTYGDDPWAAIVAKTRSTQVAQRLNSKPFTGDPQQLAKILLNGWAQELGLYAVEDDDPRLMLQNLWNNVQAYYATLGSARAFLYVRSGQLPPTTHAKNLRAVRSLVTDSRLLPCPWELCCVTESPLVFKGFATTPRQCHNLEAAADPFDVAAKALKTTRRRDIDARVSQRKQELKLDRAPKGMRQQIDSDLDATTVFDFLWRNRTRSNYGDPSLFYVGSLSQQRSARYVQSVRMVTSATMLMFETLIAQRAPAHLIDTAVHFMSRDRTRISDRVLGTRLRALGLLDDAASDDDDFW